MAISKLSLVKLFELILTLICVWLHYNTYSSHRDNFESMLITGTFVGYSIILIGGFIGYLASTPVHRRIDMLFSIIGAVLFITCGVFIIRLFENYGRGESRNLGLTKAAVSIVDGVVFLIDALLLWRGEY